MTAQSLKHEPTCNSVLVFGSPCNCATLWARQPQPQFIQQANHGCINLGCSDRILPDVWNVDIAPGPGVDEIVDLREPWPWPDNSVERLIAHDVIEHLYNKIRTMNEMHRVLKPSGRVEICVPTTDGPGAFQDPTHTSFWNRRSFLYYEAGNIYRERFAKAYGITAAFKIVSDRLDRTVDGPKLTIVLEAVKG